MLNNYSLEKNITNIDFTRELSNKILGIVSYYSTYSLLSVTL